LAPDLYNARTARLAPPEGCGGAGPPASLPRL